MTRPATLEAQYEKALAEKNSDIALHLPVLRRYAGLCRHVTEFGFREGNSAAALLLGTNHLVTYDILPTWAVPHFEQLAATAGKTFVFKNEDTRYAEVASTDMLFVDSLHTYEQVRDELHGVTDNVQKYIFFHDVEKFGQRGQDERTPGIWQAICEWSHRNPEWVMIHYEPENNGLAGFARRYRQWSGPSPGEP